MTFNDLFPLKPHRGVGFRDISPFLMSERRFEVYRALAQKVEKHHPEVTVLAALDARGYLVAEGIAAHLSSKPGILQVRKKGKLPGETTSAKFEYEYASSEFEIAKGFLQKGQQVLIVDDVLATGGSAAAAWTLVEQEGGKCVGAVFLLALEDLGGREKLYPLRVTYLTTFTGQQTPEEVAAQTQVPMVPTKIPPQMSIQPVHPRAPIVLFPLPSQLAKAKRLVHYAPQYFEIAKMEWNMFPDGWGNITFPDADALGPDRHLVYLGSFRKPSYVMEQFSMITAMCGQLAKSYTLDFPYLPVTFERVTHGDAKVNAHGLVEFSEQSVATAHTLCKQLAGAVSGRPTLRYFDIHAEAVRFFADDTRLLPVESSMLPSFLRLLATEYSNQVCMIAFPDDGAAKRFMSFLKGQPHAIATCAKKRGAGEERQVSVKDIYVVVDAYHQQVDPDAFLTDNEVQQIFLVDDLVQSGSTLYECATALRAKFPQAVMNAFTVHAIFPQDAHLRFAAKGKWAGTFHKFYVTDTVPEVVEQLRGLPPFQVLDTTPVLAEKYLRQFGLRQTSQRHNVAVATRSSPEKLQATTHAFHTHFPFSEQVEVYCYQDPDFQNPVSPQPRGYTETLQGALSRLEAAKTSQADWVVSIENGSFLKPYTTDQYEDQAVIVVYNRQSGQTYHTCTWPVPLDAECMNQSLATGCQEEAGKFIALKYQTSATDWHAKVAGVSRVDLLKAAIELLLYQF